MRTDGWGLDNIAPEGTPTDVVRAQVERILASPGFATSERHSKLLRHLVSMSLAGRGAEIKEYALGVELFGRGDSFDPSTDAIVRTEASRLRAKLKAHYGGDGRDDPVVVDLPARSYVPVFNARKTPATDAVSPPGDRRRSWFWILTALLITVGTIVYGAYRAGHAKTSGVADVGDGGDVASVAVLPFVNSDSDPAVEQFADGLTEELIETLAEIEGIRVVSRSSAFQFKGKQEDIRTIAAKLNVGAVLEGTVRRSGKRWHITARPINAVAGYPYYSHVYEPEFKDAVTVQREIAAHVASALRIRQKAQEVARFTNSPEAHELYLRGLNHASRVSESELRQAIDCFRRAIGYDPNYSPAYAGLADTYVVMGLLNEGDTTATRQRAEAAARSAVKTGATFAHAHAALGSVLALYNWDWAGAEKEFRKAIEEDPDDSSILQQYAMRYLAPQSNLDSALFELQLAQRVDPYSPNVILNRGKVECLEREPERALTDIHSALGLDSELEVGPLALAEAYVQSSRFDEASKTLQECSAPTEDEARLAALGRVYGLTGRPERARQVLEQLAELDRHYQHVSGYYFSQVYLVLGEKSVALGWLERAAEERSPQIVYVKVAPQFDGLRAEPRFLALLKRIGLGR